MLNIVVITKTVVPIVSTVKVDEKTGSLIREGVPTTLNPWDYAAIDLAIKLRDEYGGKIVAISMAPPFAKDVLEDIIGMGVDEAVLVSDRAFAGSDTLATSYILAAAIRYVMPDFDIVLAGQEAADSLTSHVPAQVASFLSVPYLYYVINVVKIDLVNKIVNVERILEDEDRIEEFKVKLPAVFSVYKKNIILPVKVSRKIEAKLNRKVKIITNRELNLDQSKIGLAGSPTRVAKVVNYKYEPKSPLKIEKSCEEFARWLLDLIQEKTREKQ
ncbi:MAG: electron transfer flavoprotein subunit beta/FixA family protein [Crenarchaeota archaeon]|nr:electron transfer flavoprotein subunit beta/FixA family protein [Thermoproteota archaeon]